ncbi:MAG: peptide chain release factor 3 [Paludibacteraceae bacterium]|nr:peptide chain release factor 3 [Paludibacteraceae bacterium]
MGFIEEIKRRRTFAVVSHPDAGKTTLTEKLLLFGGAIHIAGAVKSNKIKKTATSDWMEIEKQRGISVATSVMAFDYNGYKINILDTPGHQDFQEDTFRTLTAVDSVIIVIDCAKGVEAQTRKLMEVCRMRKTPVIVFVNKMDRNGNNAFDLCDEVEKELHIKVRPLSWPINQGEKFKGVYNIYKKQLNLFTPSKQTISECVEFDDVNNPELEKYIGTEDAEQLRTDIELIEGVYPEFDINTYLSGDVAPVFFGSALNNFGIKELLECFCEIAPCPQPTQTAEREIKPEENGFSGFVFKIHANMDPNHRSCIAFVKVCSGKFERNVNYKHVRQGKLMKFSSPTAFMAQKKETVDEAYPGDIVGLPDSNSTFKIGDTLSSGEDIHFKGIPSFSPEMFKYIENADPMKAKQLTKGIEQLMDEGVAQLFTNQFNGRRIVGTVGQLQFEVIQYRLEHEYNAQCRWEPISLYKACWIESDDKAQLEDFKKRKFQYMATDKDGRDVFLADSGYILQMAQSDFPHIKFHFSSEF